MITLEYYVIITLKLSFIIRRLYSNLKVIIKYRENLEKRVEEKKKKNMTREIQFQLIMIILCERKLRVCKTFQLNYAL